MLTTIFIDQLQIHAPIGWYEEERMNKVGLSVSVRLKLDSKSLSDELNQTIDYATITQWVLTIAERPVKLTIEYLCGNEFFAIFQPRCNVRHYQCFCANTGNYRVGV